MRFPRCLLVPFALVGMFPCVLAAAPPLPETPLFRTFGTADGLPSSSVYSLAQDHEGFLWIGTLEGLVRYDGVGFEVFRHASDEPDSLPSNNVQDLHVDAEGRLWAAAEGGGVSRLEALRPARFTHFNRHTDPRIEADDVFAIASAADGSLWFGGFRTGLYRMHTGRDEVEVYRHDPERADSLAGDTVLSLLQARDGTLWVGTTGGLCRQRGAGFDCHRPPSDSTRGHWVWQLEERADGGLHVGTSDALWRFDFDGGTARFERWSGLPGANVLSILDEGDGHLWVGLSTGLQSLRGQDWVAAEVQPGLRWAFPGRMVMSVLRDHEEGLWFATSGGGLARLPPAWRDFSVFRREPERSGSVPLSLAQARDGALLVVGHASELERLDLGSGEIRTLRPGEDLAPNRPRSVLQRADGSLWLGLMDGLLIRDADGREQRFGTDGEHAVPSGEVDHLLETPEGVWLGVIGGGLQLRDPQGRVLRDFGGPEAGGTLVETEHLARAPDGALWWAGPGGLFRRPPEGGEFTPVPGSPATRVFGFAFSGGDELWLHHLTGLERHRWDGSTLERIEGIGVQAGLPEVESGGLVVLPDGELWLTTGRGLFRYRPPLDGELAELRQFTERNGLPSSEFRNRQAPLLTREGYIAALTLGGVVVFDPARLRGPAKPSPLHWHEASVIRRGERIELPAGPIELQHGDRDLRIGLRLLSFADPGTHTYRFKLEGVDPGWIETGRVPERAYAQLAPGRYRLQVSAAGADGRWVPALVRDLHVAPAWWWTPAAWLAYAVVALLALLMLVLAYRRRLAARYRLRMAEQAQRLAQEASEAKGRFLATLGHEVRTPMAGLLGMNALLLASPLNAEQRRQAEAVRRSGQMMLRLVNEALDVARIEAGKLDLLPQAVDLPALVEEVVELQRPLAQAKGLRLTLTLAPDAVLQVEVDPLRLQQILLNLLGNAIKFTRQGAVELQVSAFDCGRAGRVGLRFEVVDTGPGLSEAQLAALFQPFAQAEGARTAREHGGSGLGLSISRQLAEAMDGSVSARSEPGLGSRFALQIAAPALGAALAGVEAAGLPMPSIPRIELAVLLVEDHPDVAEALVGLMRTWGCRVERATHALEALPLLDAQQFDVAVLDIDLPGVDGFQLAGLLRGRVPRLVALTARADADSAARADAAGFDVFLRKPAEPAELRAALRGVAFEGASPACKE